MLAILARLNLTTLVPILNPNLHGDECLQKVAVEHLDQIPCWLAWILPEGLPPTLTATLDPRLQKCSISHRACAGGHFGSPSLYEIITLRTDTVLKSKPQFLEITPPTKLCTTTSPHTLLPSRTDRRTSRCCTSVCDARNRRFRCLSLHVVQHSRITPEAADEARAAAVKAARGTRVRPRRILVKACVVLRLQITTLNTKLETQLVRDLSRVHVQMRDTFTEVAGTVERERAAVR